MAQDNAGKMVSNLYNRANPAFSAPTLVSGTALQDTTLQDSEWLIQITGGASGTVKVEIGPTNAVANTIVAATAANAVASQVVRVPVPAGWWIKVTVAVATIAATVQIAR